MLHPLYLLQKIQFLLKLNCSYNILAHPNNPRPAEFKYNDFITMNCGYSFNKRILTFYIKRHTYHKWIVTMAIFWWPVFQILSQDIWSCIPFWMAIIRFPIVILSCHLNSTVGCMWCRCQLKLLHRWEQLDFRWVRNLIVACLI